MLIGHKSDLDYERRVTSEEGVKVWLASWHKNGSLHCTGNILFIKDMERSTRF